MGPISPGPLQRVEMSMCSLPLKGSMRSASKGAGMCSGRCVAPSHPLTSVPPKKAAPLILLSPSGALHLAQRH